MKIRATHNWVSVGCAVITLITLTACTTSLPGAAPAAAPQLELVPVELGDIDNHVVAIGRVIATQTATLTFNRSGKIAKLEAREGEWVKQGQVIAALDTRDLELIAKQQHASYISALAQYSQTLRGVQPSDLRQAQAELASARQRLADLDKGPSQVQVADLQSSVELAEAEVKRAQAEYDAANRANPSGISASPEAATLEQKTIALRAAKARLQAAYEKPQPGQYSEVRAQVAAAQARISALNPVSETIVSSQALSDQAFYIWQQAEQALQDTQIVVPFDGLVTNVSMAVGDSTSANGSIQIADFKTPLFEADVDEADLGKIKVGMDARVLLQSYVDIPLDAIVKSIGKVGRQNGSIIVYRVRLELLGNADVPVQPEVLLNMSGTTQLITAESADAMLVPVSAVTHDEDTGTDSVQIPKGDGSTGETTTVEIKAGLRNSESVEVLEGLKEGDMVVLPEPENVPLEGPSVN